MSSVRQTRRVIFHALLFLSSAFFSKMLNLAMRTGESTTALSDCKTESKIEAARRTAELKWNLTRCEAETKEIDAKAKEVRRRWYDQFYKIPGFYECTGSEDELAAYFHQFRPHGRCPNDWPLAQKLILNSNCHTLKSRLCLSSAQPNFVEPLPYPQCLWETPDDRNVDWTHYECKSFHCLKVRKRGDCLGCFKLTEEERPRWDSPGHKQPSMAQVFGLKPNSIRVGIDVGGGTGTFAATAREMFGATIVTTGMNTGAPFLETIALRGLPALQHPHLARLPFRDGTMDLIHSMHSVHILETEDFELMLYDWDRVLRPGGLIWLEKFYQIDEIIDSYIQVIKSFNYKTHFWVRMEKDEGQTALTAVLEKPFSRPEVSDER